MCCLQSLGLGGNEIHDEGAIHLALALRANRRLRSLGLGGNQIGIYIIQVCHTCTHKIIYNRIQLMKVEELWQRC